MEAPIGVTIFAKDADPLGPNLNTHQNGPSFDDKSRENRLMSYLNPPGVSCTQENIIVLTEQCKYFISPFGLHCPPRSP